jgi:hypothetical protein
MAVSDSRSRIEVPVKRTFRSRWNSRQVVLYGSETWSLILREECKLRVFENGVLRRIFGPKRDEVTGE